MNWAISPHHDASYPLPVQLGAPVEPAFCLGLPSDSPSQETPLPSASTSPCRACRGLSPPSHPEAPPSGTVPVTALRAMPGAPKKNASQR